jgi:hypothetical protein
MTPAHRHRSGGAGVDVCAHCEYLALCRQRVMGIARDGLRSVMCERVSAGNERVDNPQPDAEWRRYENDRAYRQRHARKKRVAQLEVV